MPRSQILNKSFYLRPTLEVARDLIGKYLVYKKNNLWLLSARLVEVEAYIGGNDPACHASRGRTPRNEVMFGPGGFSYIYLIYGMYYCLNVVTEKDKFPAAILIRAAEPVDGVDLMKKNYNMVDTKLTSGPGRLCKAFGLNLEHNGLDLAGPNLYLEDRGYNPGKIISTPRIGISRAVKRNWRFVEKDSPYVSVKLKK